MKQRKKTKIAFSHHFLPVSASLLLPDSSTSSIHISKEQRSGRRTGVAVSPSQSLSFLSSISHFFLLLHGSLPRAAIPQDKPAPAWFSCPGPQLFPGPCSCESSPWCSFLWAMSTCASVESSKPCSVCLLHHGPLHKLQGSTCSLSASHFFLTPHCRAVNEC